jgi:UDP-N-acetylmuramate: L-alanyl-gamma-D-glutamyl-meso-diaminopimelate ligase
MAAVNKFRFIDIAEMGMCLLASSLKKSGAMVTGSFAEIDPALKSHLEKAGVQINNQGGWSAEALDASYTQAIIGPGADADNPEVLKAQELGIKISSFPEYIGEKAKDKQRIVIAGTNNRIATLAITLFVLKQYDRKFDYVTITPVPGFEDQIKITQNSVILIEGDEVMTSGIDRASRFLRYNQHICVISGLTSTNGKPNANDMETFANASPKGGTIIYNAEDKEANRIGSKERTDVQLVPFKTPGYKSENGKLVITDAKEPVAIRFDNKEEIQSISAARELLKKIGITTDQFYSALSNYK